MYWLIFIYLIFSRWSLCPWKWRGTNINMSLSRIFNNCTSVPTSHGGAVLLVVGLLTLSPSRTTRPTSRCHGTGTIHKSGFRACITPQANNYLFNRLNCSCPFFYWFGHLSVIIPTSRQQYWFSSCSFRAPPWIPDNLRIMWLTIREFITSLIWSENDGAKSLTLTQNKTLGEYELGKWAAVTD